MKSLVRKKYSRKRFSETANFKDLPLDDVAIPVEKGGSVVDVFVKQKSNPVEEIPYNAFTAAKNYEMGKLAPISLVNNMTSADQLEYVKSFESSIDLSIEKSKN